jgi:benzoyl-CoA reductase/2-hydroxyglutaryl-CoA dehydratase subunit BcrC/BadD/HgdB
MKQAEPRIGWLCSYVPEEIIMAAGLLPSRVSGSSEELATAEAHLYTNLCPYVKGVLAAGLSGETKQLDGMIFVRSCDAMRRLYDVWKSYVPMRFVHMLEAPKNRDAAAVEYFAAQLRSFATALGQEFGSEISVKSLNQAIKTANQARRLMQGLYQRQRGAPLPLPGSQIFQLGLEGMAMAKKDFIGRLEEYGKKGGSQTIGKGGDGNARVLITGNVVDRPDLFNMVEAAGAEVPVADLCTATRHFNFLVDEDEADPYVALARGYLNKPRCPRIAGLEERFAQMMELVDGYKVDGVIYTSVKFCDQHLADAPYFLDKLKEKKMPALFLENDYVWRTTGQLKTRVGAFVEMLDAGRR